MSMSTTENFEDSEEGVTVRVSHHFAAAAERVFDAWTDPSIARKFLFASATGQVVRTEIDGRVGGGFTIVERRR
ncbi:MAG: SRPBCC domain-containing protein, partial [Myxococcales bacterium]